MVMFSLICFLSFHTFLLAFPENLLFPSAFIVPAHSHGGSGGGPGAPSRAFGGHDAVSNCYYFVGFKGMIAH